MDVDDLCKYISPDLVARLKEEKITKLYPPQVDAINAGLFEGKSMVLSVPTAAGKTLVAALAAMDILVKRHAKVVYIVPLVALASEKYEYFKNLFAGKWKVAQSVGDLDSADPWLAEYDFIVSTTEKLDSLTRHDAPWVKEIGLVIVDEVHTLNDPMRGPTLEMMLTKLRHIVPGAQTLSLSATIKNGDELAEWLDAKLVLSDFRPVKLYEGVSFGQKIKFFDKEGYDIKGVEHEKSILENTMDMRKQAIFFVATRRNAESLATSLAVATKPKLTRIEKGELERLSEEVLNVLETPTRQCKKLAECVKYGTAFHHAGLMRKQKSLIEDGFRSGQIRAICATPTLAMGVNLPAFRVVIRDARRYYQGVGSAYIPVLEYKQFVGRAGRPQYDKFGESILFAKTESEAQELTDRYILGDPEKITSKLAVEPILRMHTLALIANSFVNTEESLFKFFSKTFYAFQYGDISVIEEKLLEILENLVEWKFISAKEGKIHATKIGKRVSELYIDPLTAHNFIEALEFGRKKLEDFGMLQTICSSGEMTPQLTVRSGEFAEVNELVAKKERELLQQIPNQWDLEYDRFLSSVKTAMFLGAWLGEKSEDEILGRFNVAPGELNGRLQIADWLVYSLQELGLLLGKKDMLKDIRKLRVRLKYGISEELVPLVRLRTIGRVRSRRLYNAGLRSLDDLRKATLPALSKLLGAAIAQSVKQQLGEKIEESEIIDTRKSIQSKLGSYNNDDAR
jgi:helicase